MIVKPVIGTKYQLGLGRKKKEENLEWRVKLAHELHKPIKRKFPTRSVIVWDIDDTWSADLADCKLSLPSIRGLNTFSVIDMFGRYAWAVPMKDKTGSTVTNALEKMLSESNRVPKSYG